MAKVLSNEKYFSEKVLEKVKILQKWIINGIRVIWYFTAKINMFKMLIVEQFTGEVRNVVCFRNKYYIA